MNDIRIVSCLSPKLEDSLLAYSIDDDLIKTFEDSVVFFNNAKHLTMLIIPNQLLAYFNAHPRLRMLKESIIINPQSNVIFARIQLPDDCKESDFSTKFDSCQSSVASLTQIIWYLSQRKIPSLIDCEANVLEKRHCDLCGFVHPCYPDISLHTYKLPDFEQFKQMLLEVAGRGIEHWSIKRESATPLDMKILAFLLCVFYGFPDELVSQVKDIDIHEKFCRDIKDSQGADIVNIILSLTRAALLPSASDPNTRRHELSIDWHRHDPFKLGHYKLYRVDVVACSRTGITGSGVERILMADDGVRKQFIAYTSTHEFVTDTIRGRLENLI